MTVKLFVTSASLAVTVAVPALPALRATLLPPAVMETMLLSEVVHLTVPVVTLPAALYGVAVTSTFPVSFTLVFTSSCAR